VDTPRRNAGAERQREEGVVPYEDALTGPKQCALFGERNRSDPRSNQGSRINRRQGLGHRLNQPFENGRIRIRKLGIQNQQENERLRLNQPMQTFETPVPNPALILQPPRPILP